MTTATQAKAKLFSSPLPLRAIGDQRLAGLDLRVLAAIAAHDRMSMARGEGQGCWISNGSLAGKVGCDYSNLSKAIKKLGELGYILREKPTFGDRRSHVYRVVGDLYSHEESLSFHQQSTAMPAHPSIDCTPAAAAPPGEQVGDLTNTPAEIVRHPNPETGGLLRETASQYISQSEVRYSAEAGEDTHLEYAHLVVRDACQNENGRTVEANLARFDRALKGYTLNREALATWAEWFRELLENYEDPDETYYWAQRLEELLHERAELWAWEAGAVDQGRRVAGAGA